MKNARFNPSKTRAFLESVGEGAKNVGDEVEEKVKDESTENGEN